LTEAYRLHTAVDKRVLCLQQSSINDAGTKKMFRLKGSVRKKKARRTETVQIEKTERNLLMGARRKKCRRKKKNREISAKRGEKSKRG